MPNHVYNKMTVTGSAEALAAFKTKTQRLDEDNHPREFSYWNFITPPQEALDSGEYYATHGFVDGKDSGNTKNNWYNFNVREWGTKWDAYDIQPDEYSITATSWTISWNSAWSPPMPVFNAISEQHPELEFDFYWEEEQGWGGEGIGATGSFSITKEWDIPESHAQWVELDMEENCACNRWDDQEEWFADCPRKEETNE
jgi:hypothetical protein